MKVFRKIEVQVCAYVCGHVHAWFWFCIFTQKPGDCPGAVTVATPGGGTEVETKGKGKGLLLHVCVYVCVPVCF